MWKKFLSSVFGFLVLFLFEINYTKAEYNLVELNPGFNYIEWYITETGFKPDFIILDSLSAVSSTFSGKDQSYRFYVERLFRFFEKIGCTTFLITETQQIPELFSPTGVEEFLADGVIVFYNFRKENVRETAIEVLKMRGEKHQKKIVALKINERGIAVYPDVEVFGALELK